MRFPDRTTRRLAVLGTAGVLAVGAFALPALAQDGSETPSEGTTGQDQEARGRTAFAEALADELGVSVDRVTDAIAAARETVAAEWEDERLAELRQRLDDAVADGTLTQEQADAIAEAAEAGVLPGRPGPPAFHGRGPVIERHGGIGPGLAREYDVREPPAEDTGRDGA